MSTATACPPLLAPLLIRFDPTTGLSPDRPALQRRLSDLAGVFVDETARQARQAINDDLVYEFHDLGLPERSEEIAFGTSIVRAGQVAGEYFMTKGHFHTILGTAEVYYCLQGEGFLLLEDQAGHWSAQPLRPGSAVYVPGGQAHRSINTGAKTLITFYAFRADAGHDYGTIARNGFRMLCVERDGQPEFIPNPRWGSARGNRD